MIYGATGGCLPDNEDCGDYRRRECIRLQKRFIRGEIPTLEEIRRCYDCTMTLPWSDHFGNYVRALEAAKQDGILSASEFDRMIDFATKNPDLLGLGITIGDVEVPTLQQSLIDALGLGDGYLEGASFTAGISGQTGAVGGQIGQEIVYNFVTFQSMVYRYIGWAVAPSVSGNANTNPTNLTVSLDAQIANYFGYIRGFTWKSPYDSFGAGPYYDNFIKEYSGPLKHLA